MSRFGLLGAAGLLGVAACQPAETPEQMQARMEQETAAFKEYAIGVEKRWEAWAAAGQADSFPTVFMEDGREMPANGMAVVGRAAIREFHAQQASMGTFTAQITQESAMANGPLAVDRGTYTSTFTPNRGMENMGVPPADTGKWVVHWQQVNDTWQIAALIYNSDLPLPAPAPARRR
ncbi:MAG: nuclear transport factor 2 family protein [Gemmatimonadetes bacterium]|nr:nuclear transport factor 2 family protein [Gemmatimonadota bacterium]